MAKFKMKPMIVEAITFDELVEYGLEHSDNIIHHMPWSFEFMGIPITHETDDCYIVDTERFTRNHLLVVKDNEISIAEKDAFDLISEPLEENNK